jgi:hypothetical protein
VLIQRLGESAKVHPAHQHKRKGVLPVSIASHKGVNSGRFYSVTGSGVNVSARIDFIRSLLWCLSDDWFILLKGVTMKKALLLTFCILGLASLAFAQAGNLDITADAAGTDCNLVSDMGELRCYVVHRNVTTGVAGSNFKVEQSNSGLEIDTAKIPSGCLSIGDPDVGIAITYASCMTNLPIWVLRLDYIGDFSPCDRLTIVGDPTAQPPGIFVTDCATPIPNLYEITTGGTAYIDSDGSCDCNVPSEDTSWGQIKALYR